MSPLEKAAEELAKADSFALACHVGPDGDALGSMIGFGLAARAAGKNVVASFGSPFVVPGNLSFLDTDMLIPPQDFPESPETMVVFDVGSAERLGELASSAASADQLVVLDHHVTNDGFGDIAVVDPHAAATGEIVVALLDLLGWELTPAIADCLHTAIVTDTGRFQYTNTTADTFRIAARLLEAGAQPAEISRHVYEEAPFGYLKASAAALGRAELDQDLSLVTAVITQDDLNEAGIDWGDIDNLINTVRLAQEADSAVIAKVHEDGRVKVSMRSRGDTDVGGLAAELGGGGHRLAAGFTSTESADDVLAKIKQSIARFR